MAVIVLPNNCIILPLHYIALQFNFLCKVECMGSLSIWRYRLMLQLWCFIKVCGVFVSTQKIVGCLQGLFFNQWGVIMFYATLIVIFSLKCDFSWLHQLACGNMRMNLCALTCLFCEPKWIIIFWQRFGWGCRSILLEMALSTALWLRDHWRAFSPTLPQLHGHLTCIWACSFA